jgi:SSS family solute:Na+ symporter
MTTALMIMGVIVVVYTSLGGIKAVIYTDTIQWLILMSGLIFIGIPLGYSAIGGYDAIVSLILFVLLTLLFPKERNAQHIKN